MLLCSIVHKFCFNVHSGNASNNSRQTLTSSLRPSWLMGRGSNGDGIRDVRSSDGLGLGGAGRVGGKSCTTAPQCSWRLLAIALLLTCGLLAAALAYVTVSSIGAPSTADPNCILIEDAQVTSPREDTKIPHKGKLDPLKGSFQAEG